MANYSINHYPSSCSVRRALLALAAMAAGLVVVVGLTALPAQAQDTTATTDTASGTTIKVNTIEDESTDDGDCSLREAIEAADTNLAVDRCPAGSETERDAIHFSLGKKATIVLGSQLPPITDPSGLTINGQKAKITVSGNDAVQVFFVDEAAKLALRNLTVAHGYVDASSGSGGGLHNLGTAEITNSTFSDNRANNMHSGGIDNGGTLRVDKSTFSRNIADGHGKDGGAIQNRPGGTLTLSNSTFSENSAHRGGGIINSGTAEVKNSTFSKNSAGFRGGGIHNEGPTVTETSLTLSNSTFSENSATDSGGGLHQSITATTTLSNTIIANSTSGGNCNKVWLDSHVPITDGGYNIEDQNTCRFDDDPSTSTSKAETDPKLSSRGLRNNGGPTKTIAILSTSPAKNAIPQGTNGCGTEIKTDQREVKRPQGANCDIGAFEKKKR